jgi:hypothetical protein
VGAQTKHHFELYKNSGGCCRGRGRASTPATTGAKKAPAKKPAAKQPTPNPAATAEAGDAAEVVKEAEEDNEEPLAKALAALELERLENEWLKKLLIQQGKGEEAANKDKKEKKSRKRDRDSSSSSSSSESDSDSDGYDDDLDALKPLIPQS